MCDLTSHTNIRITTLTLKSHICFHTHGETTQLCVCVIFIKTIALFFANSVESIATDMCCWRQKICWDAFVKVHARTLTRTSLSQYALSVLKTQHKTRIELHFVATSISTTTVQFIRHLSWTFFVLYMILENRLSFRFGDDPAAGSPTATLLRLLPGSNQCDKNGFQHKKAVKP